MASQGKKMESNFELDRDSFEVQKAWRQFDAPFSSETLKETAADLLRAHYDSHTKFQRSRVGNWPLQCILCVSLLKSHSMNWNNVWQCVDSPVIFLYLLSTCFLLTVPSPIWPLLNIIKQQQSGSARYSGFTPKRRHKRLLQFGQFR